MQHLTYVCVTLIKLSTTKIFKSPLWKSVCCTCECEPSQPPHVSR